MFHIIFLATFELDYNYSKPFIQCSIGCFNSNAMSSKKTPKNFLGRCSFAQLLNSFLRKCGYFIIRYNFIPNVGKI